MDVHWKLRHRWPRRGSLGHDELEHIEVGDPDPTSDLSTATGYRPCRFEWVSETSQTLVLPWFCTRKLGHHGQHLAGTGDRVAATHPRLLPTATRVSV